MNIKYPLTCRGILPSEDGKRSISLQKISIQKPKSNELLIKVHAAGINRADLEQAKGGYPPPQGASKILGLELAGVVVDVGNTVKNFKIGDYVMSLVSGGAYAEFALAPQETTLSIPEGLSLIEAGAIPEAYYTIWYNVFYKGNLQPSEIILVHGGVSGVGSALIQIAKAMGSTVIATVGSDNKIEACEMLGADYVINYKKQDFYKEAMRFTQQNGVHVILDWVGADYLDKHLKLLRTNGRLLCIDSRGSNAVLDFDLLLGKSLTVSGTLLRPLPLSQKKQLTVQIKKYILPKIPGELKPLVYKVIPFVNFKQGFQIVEESSHIGKVILSMNGTE